jgi:hypothetical protein
MLADQAENDPGDLLHMTEPFFYSRKRKLRFSSDEDWSFRFRL